MTNAVTKVVATSPAEQASKSCWPRVGASDYVIVCTIQSISQRTTYFNITQKEGGDRAYSANQGNVANRRVYGVCVLDVQRVDWKLAEVAA